VEVTDEIIGNYQLLGTRAWAAPKVYAYVYDTHRLYIGYVVSCLPFYRQLWVCNLTKVSIWTCAPLVTKHKTYCYTDPSQKSNIGKLRYIHMWKATYEIIIGVSQLTSIIRNGNK